MESILGIDFGTTNSAVAVFRKGKPVMIPSEFGETIIPSAVYIAENGDIYVGESAKNVAILHVDSTVLSVKREMGTGVHHFINGKNYTSEHIASFIFETLRNAAVQQTGHRIKKAVVTVPAYYDDKKRQATRKAAQLAGLEVVRIVNEPTAAAMAYGVESDDEGRVLVFDLGGGTFDVSILNIGGGVFEVLATRGDTHLGGNDFDRKMVEILVERFMDETEIDLRKDKFALQKVYEEAEKAKKALSEQRIVEIGIPFIAADESGPLHLSTRFTRIEFEELITGYVEKTLRLTKTALSDANLKPEDIDRLLFVGGSTRIPNVRENIKKFFKREPERNVSPDEVVALGAAIQGAVMSGQMRKTALVDVTPLGLGVENESGHMVTMIRRNSVLPIQASAIFTTVQDYQRAVIVHVLQGERPYASDNISLGSFRLDGIRKAPKGVPKIEVRFEIDVSGMVRVSAKDLDTQCEYSVKLDQVSNLSEDEVSAVITDAMASELEDLKFYSEQNGIIGLR
jgi:molecular chaperone DnaK